MDKAVQTKRTSSVVMLVVVVAVVGTLLMMLVPWLAVRLAAIGEQSTPLTQRPLPPNDIWEVFVQGS